MKRIFWLLLLVSTIATAQKKKKAQIKADNLIITSLQSHIGFLADDKLEGRRTGSAGEKLAYEYISKKFEEAGLSPKGENGTYIQPFEVNEGKEINAATFLSINGFNLRLDTDYFPFTFSANGKVKLLLLLWRFHKVNQFGFGILKKCWKRIKTIRILTWKMPL